MTYDRFHPNCPDRPMCYARCSVCEETFEEEDMEKIYRSFKNSYLGPEDVAEGRCKWCPKPEED